MSKPTDPDRSTPASRVPQSGRKFIDPTKYQMDTVPAELVAKIAQMKIESMPEEALKPPPLYDERPVIGRLRRLGVRLVRYKIPLLVGILIGLCVVITMAMMGQGSTANGSNGAVVATNAQPEMSPPAGQRIEPTRAAAPELAISAEPVEAPKPGSPSTVTSAHNPTVSGPVVLPMNSQQLSPSPAATSILRGMAPPAVTANRAPALHKTSKDNDPDAPFVP